MSTAGSSPADKKLCPLSVIYTERFTSVIAVAWSRGMKDAAPGLGKLPQQANMRSDAGYLKKPCSELLTMEIGRVFAEVCES